MRVLIADDANLIRDCLQEMVSVSRQVELVGSFTNVTDTLEGLRTLKPDLDIIGLEMPGLNGIEVLKEISHLNLLKCSELKIFVESRGVASL